MTLRRNVIPLFALALAALLTACAPGAPDTETVDDPAATAPSGESDSTGEPTEEPTEEADPVVDLRADIIEAMNLDDPAALEVHLAPSVHVTYAASEMEGDVTEPANVIQDLEALTGGGISWDFELPDSVVDNYANNPGHYPSYADDFPPGAIVGRSSDGKVVSFAYEGSLITRVFIALDEFALTFE